MALERIKVFLDLDGKSFFSNLKAARTEMAATDGLFNKLKVGASGLGSAFKDAAKNPAVMGAAVVGAGAAAFAAVDKFADLALEVGRVSDATGISAESLSRMKEVAEDANISFSVIEKVIGKMNTTAGTTPGLFDELGVAIARNDDGNVEANETFLNVIDTLNGIQDPAKKAAAAQKLLGRGWRDMAELIGQGSDQVRESLAKVSDAKVVDDGEVQKARDYRAAMDELKDKFEELALSLGESLIPALTLVADLLAKIGDVAEGLGFIKDMLFGTNDQPSWMSDAMGKDAEEAADKIIFVKDALTDLVAGPLTETQRETRRVAEATEDASDAFEHAGLTAQDLADAQREATEAAEDAHAALVLETEAHYALIEAKEKLINKGREGIDAERDYADALDSAEDSARALGVAIKEHGAMSEEADDAMRSAVDDAIAMSEAFVALQGKSLDSAEGIDAQVWSLTAFRDTLAPGSPLRLALDEYIKKLLSIPKTLDTRIGMTIVGTTGGVTGGIDPKTGLPRRTIGPDDIRGRRTEAGPGITVDDFLNSGQAGVWTAPAAGAGTGQATRDEIELMRRKLDMGKISQEEFLRFLQERLDAEKAANGDETDLAYELFVAIRDIRNQQLSAQKASADEEADAVEKAEQRKQEAIRRTFEMASALGQLGAAEESVSDALESLSDADATLWTTTAAAQQGEASAEQVSDAQEAQSDAIQAVVDAVIRGVRLRAQANGLNPDTPEGAAFVRSEITAWLQGPNRDRFAAGLNAYLATLPSPGALGALGAFAGSTLSGSTGNGGSAAAVGGFGAEGGSMVRVPVTMAGRTVGELALDQHMLARGVSSAQQMMTGGAS